MHFPERALCRGMFINIILIIGIIIPPLHANISSQMRYFRLNVYKDYLLGFNVFPFCFCIKLHQNHLTEGELAFARLNSRSVLGSPGVVKWIKGAVLAIPFIVSDNYGVYQVLLNILKAVLLTP